MAYTLNDYFRPLRTIFRVNGLINGLLLGFCMLFVPRFVVALLGSSLDVDLWPLRFAGVYAMATGMYLLNRANERTIPPAISLLAIVINGLTAGVLLLAYLQQEIAPISLAGQIILTALFILNLLGAVIPIRFMRSDYRRM
ncbi:MAG: hypothetical protein AAF702_03615 [Chloroflexota bacterium]